jgi:hypothetical protein
MYARILIDLLGARCRGSIPTHALCGISAVTEPAEINRHPVAMSFLTIRGMMWNKIEIENSCIGQRHHKTIYW